MYFFSPIIFQSVLSMETNTKNVTSAVSILNSKLCLLEPNHLDHIGK